MEKAILLWLSKKYGNLQLFQHPKHSNNILYFKEKKLIININQYNKHIGINMDIFNFISTFFELDYFETDKVLHKWINENYFKESKLIMSLTYVKYWENEYDLIL